MTRPDERAAIVLAVCGLAAEAKIARAGDVGALAGGGDVAALEAAVEGAIATGVRALVSFGIAGALDPLLASGRLIVARSVRGPGAAPMLTDRRWSDALLERLPDAIEGDIAGSDAIVASAAMKAALRAATGAVAVDMESHHVGRIAAQRGLPFIVLRAVADPADRHVPHAARVAMRPGGGIDFSAVLASLARSPTQIAGLCRLGLDSRRALQALLQGRRRLGNGLGHPDLDELALHVV